MKSSLFHSSTFIEVIIYQQLYTFQRIFLSFRNLRPVCCRMVCTGGRTILSLCLAKKKKIGCKHGCFNLTSWFGEGYWYLSFFLCWVISLHRAYRRYFYMNKKTSQTQWDYPEEEDEEEADETGHTDRQHSMSSRLVSGKW